MKVLLTIAFDGDRDPFARRTLELVQESVRAGAARMASIDVRLPDAELEAFGPALVAPEEERAVVTFWDTEATDAMAVPLAEGARLVGAYEVSEVVHRDYDRTWPSGAQSPGFKMIAFLHRRSDLTHEDFSTHWRERHGPLAVAHQPGFWRYVQNHLVRALDAGAPHWDGFGEIHYRSGDDALTRSYDSEDGQQLIWEDVARFLDYERSPTLTTHEWVVGAGSDPSP